jgi:hypothetical protein
MRSAFLVLVGSASLALTGCGGEAGNGVPEDDAPDDEVGVSTSELTNCVRTELANVRVTLDGSNGIRCEFRLMENNFTCDEGVVGQASTELLSTNGLGDTSTIVATRLFDENHEGRNGWATPATIATQWGHAFASTHFVICTDSRGWGHFAEWDMDPFSKRAVRR